MSKKIKCLIIFLFFLFFFFPKTTRAFIGTGIFDFFTSALEGVEEFSQFSTQLFLRISQLLLITYIALGVSSYLLQWIITTPVNLANTLVSSGFNFTLGLANTLFILIFVIIAFAYILKIETVGQKKVLANLILVALLVNFSLLFVSALVDIGNFFYNTILGSEGPSLFNEVLRGLMGNVEGMITTLATWLFGFLLLYIIPFSAPFAQLTVTIRTIATGAMLGIFGPTLMSWILTILFGLLLAGIFFLYFFFFTFRIYILWGLAVFAPLAFICLILPQTKRYWDEWLTHLLQWTFLGVILLFWLVLGLKLMTRLLPAGGPTIIPIVSWMQIGQHIQYFLFLFVYLVIGIYLERKFTPTLVGTIRELGGQVGGAIWGRVVKPGWKAFKREIPKMLAESERIQRLAQREALLERRGLAREIFEARPVRRVIGRTIGPAAIEAIRREIDATEKKVAGQSAISQLAAFRAARSDAERLGILQAIIKDKNIDAALDVTTPGHLTDAEIIQLFDTARRYDREGVIRSALPDLARQTLPPNVPPVAQMPPGISYSQFQAQYIFDRIRPADYENMSRRVLTDNEFLEAMLRRGTGEHINRFIGKFGIEGAQAIERRLQDLATAQGVTVTQWLQNNNPRLYRYFTRGAGQGLIHI